MADCGASGSAVDRVARNFLGPGDGGGQQNLANATKHINNFLGHATVAGAPLINQMPMANAMPEHLSIPSTTMQLPMIQSPPPAMQQHCNFMTNRATVDSRSMDTIWQQQQQQQSIVPHSQQMNMPNRQHFVPQISPHMASQQMQLSAVNMHHQQQMMMQQHQFAVMQQQQQQRQIQQQQIIQQQQHMQQQAMQEKKQMDLRAHAAATNIEENVVNNAKGSLEDILDFENDFQDMFAGSEAFVDGDGINDEGNASAQAEYLEELAAAWSQAQEDYDTEATANVQNNGNAAQITEYEFINTNLPDEARTNSFDYMGEGMEFFRQGKLREAIQSFETELQLRDPDNATAWRMLGKCHAENDQDREAIACLEQAVDRDPYSPEALLALGVSYVNELDHERALSNLKSWITHNPKYADLGLVEEFDNDVYGSGAVEEGESPSSHFDEVQRLLLRALDYDDSDDSANVWEALGVVYNVSRDYDAAVNAFKKAISHHPNDYQLWNKLGATLANSNQSAKALPAYQKALELKPKYARAWLNMAISHSNLQDYHEAARCYLQTLSLNPSAVHCWSYLRVALSCSETWDLIPATTAQDLSAFKEHFDFVLY